MAGIDRGEPTGSTALLGVNFEVDLGRQTPRLPDQLPDLYPCRLVGGVWELAMAATEAPGAALSNQLLFIRFQDPSSRMVR